MSTDEESMRKALREISYQMTWYLEGGQNISRADVILIMNRIQKVLERNQSVIWKEEGGPLKVPTMILGTENQ